MSMAHQIIRRTFHRVAKRGVVRCDGRLWQVTQDGKPVSGKVVMHVNVNHPYAEFPDDRFSRLNVEEIGRTQ
jgi:hypothetical protein